MPARLPRLGGHSRALPRPEARTQPSAHRHPWRASRAQPGTAAGTVLALTPPRQTARLLLPARVPLRLQYEGAFWSKYDPLAEPNNFSVMPVPETENGVAGILLGQFYDKNRLLDGPDDGLLVQIIP